MAEAAVPDEKPRYSTRGLRRTGNSGRVWMGMPSEMTALQTRHYVGTFEDCRDLVASGDWEWVEDKREEAE
jgi:hypothetical protein